MSGFKDAMGQIQINIQGVNEAIREIGMYEGRAQSEAEAAIQEGVKAIIKKAKARVPVRSGYLKKSGRSEFNLKKMQGRAAFYAPHAHLVEFGTKAHAVDPKKAKALQILDAGQGILRYAHRAKIPARRAKPFLTPSASEELPKVEKRIREALKKV